MAIDFFYQKEGFQLTNEEWTRTWIEKVLDVHGYKSGTLQFIFLSDDDLLEINRSYLKHDYYTDIITFPLGDKEGTLDSDIYISVDRVRDNAQNYASEFKDELDRVMIHGVLHLCGWKDKTEEEERTMRQKEDEALSMR
jgi:rRNA maturation RNase YbeY